MIVLNVLILCATVVGVVLLLRPRPQPVILPEPAVVVPSILDERVLESVVVTLKTGTTFAGVLYAEDRGAVVLCKAEHVGQDGKRVAADGEVVLLRDTIDFIQRP